MAQARHNRYRESRVAWVPVFLVVLVAFFVHPLLGVAAGAVSAVFAHRAGKLRIRNILIIGTLVTTLAVALFLYLGTGQYEPSPTQGQVVAFSQLAYHSSDGSASYPALEEEMLRFEIR
jgi:energy-coupling factor transporter transmembrane protein EcfT